MDNDQSLTETQEERSVSRREFIKRSGAVGLSAVSLGSMASILSSCGSTGGSSTSSNPLTFWNFYSPGGTNALENQWFADMAAQWNKTNSTQVKLVYVPTSDYINGSKLQTSFASGQGPDIFLISPGDFLRYYNGGVLQDLTPYVDKDAQQDLYANTMGTRIVNGKIYGVPMEVEPMAIYYSVDAFEKAGLNENDVPKTWDQLREVAAKLKTNKRYGITLETTPGYYQNFTWYPFMWQGGGDTVDTTTHQSSFNSPAVVQALKLWQDLVKSGVAPRTLLGTGGSDVLSNLVAGYTAMQNVGIWAISDLRQRAKDFKYGVFKLPIPQGGKPSTTLGGWAFVANAKGKNPEEAAKFCAWALASMKPDSIQRGVDWISKAKSDIGPRKSVMDKATANNAFVDPGMKAFKDEVFPSGRGEPRYPPEVYKAISDALQACMLQGSDPAQQAETASNTINGFLKTYKGASIV